MSYLFKGNEGKLDELRTWNAFKQESCVMGNVAKKKKTLLDKTNFLLKIHFRAFNATGW